MVEYGSFCVCVETMRNIIMQIMIHRSKYLHLHSCVRAPFRSHALHDILRVFFFFLFPVSHRSVVRLRQIAELGEGEGKREGKGGGLSPGMGAWHIHILQEVGPVQQTKQKCCWGFLCQFVIRLYSKLSLYVICRGKMRRAVESPVSAPVRVVRPTMPVGRVTNCL